GSLIFYASLMELLNKGKVIGIDIEIREHNRKVIEAHPMFRRIEMIERDSIADETIREIRKMVPENAKAIVCLDSNHTKAHVLKELELYKDFVVPGCYIIVFDTVISELARLGADDKKYINNSPKEAVEQFLVMNNNFKIDKQFNKLYVSTNLNGYLKRIE
ncbi:CmcI family methyltransferase, partial [Chloroflexota bacterium]